MRIGLFGGSFDPVHYGHLRMARRARRDGRLDRVLFIPAGRPPHKPPPAASARHRLAMLRRALRGRRAFAVSDYEIHRRGPGYSVRTVSHFRRRWPAAGLYFVVGSDAMRSTPRWRDARRLRRLCGFLCVRRIPPYSSSLIRWRAGRGLSLRGWVPPEVARYIARHGLYRG